MGRQRLAREFLMIAGLLFGAQACVDDGTVSSSADDEADVLDASVEEVEDKEATASGTDDLVGRVAALPDKTLVVFDFDDTLRDHVDGGSSRWATYAKSAITYLKQHRIAISVCSRNSDANALKKALRSLDSTVFTDAFFRSAALQTDTGLDKSDDIRQIMSYFGIRSDRQVVFYDDNQDNIDRVKAGTNVISINVRSNGIDRDEFRAGMTQRLSANSGGGSSSGGGTSGSCSGKCSSSCRCTVGQGDCDTNADCASGLICPPDGDGAERCMKR